MEFDGRQSSLLAQLAQKPDPENEFVKKMVAELTGDARAVAEALVGISQSDDTRVMSVVGGLKRWAASLT